MLAFANFRPTLDKLADEEALADLHGLALDAHKLGERLRKPTIRGMPDYAEVLAILCARLVFWLDQIRYQVEGRKQKEALVHFMGPCVACFELLFGQLATGGSDYKPSPFTLFVASFLERVQVPRASWRTVRKYFQKWQRRAHA